MPYYALLRNRRVSAVVTVESQEELQSLIKQGQSTAALSDEAFHVLSHNPHLMSEASVDQEGRLIFPKILISQEKQDTESKGKMRRTLDLKAADVVFDGRTCFLQAPVEFAKLSIVDAAGVPVLTFQVDSPFSVQFPEGAELFCLSNNVTLYYVAGWD